MATAIACSQTISGQIADQQLLESLLIQIWAIYRSGGDLDLGATVATQIESVAGRLPSQVAQAALMKYGIIDGARTI
jgi:hypothetical protein